ncbi:MAG TPA: DinB family protein [Flavisolibacter sp.]|nr:DinB family protein [Flavisolibacter sp.]
MNKNIEIIRQTRLHLLALIEGLDTHQLNRVPPGFNNNIAWNLIHLMAAQQNVCYVRAGLSIVIPEKFFTPYLPGTKPDGIIDDDMLHEARELFIGSIDRLKEDYDKALFSNYTFWKNRYGIEHSSIEDTLSFLPFHEGLHFGYVMALKRCL